VDVSDDWTRLAWRHVCDIDMPIAGLVDSVVLVDVALIDAGCALRLTTPEYGYVEHHEVASDLSDPTELSREGVRQAFLRRALLLGRVTREGLLNRAAIEELSRAARFEREAARDFQRRRINEIVELARELKLFPDTDGLVRGRWEARCPGTSHSLEIQTQTNLFRCGYCRVGGGLEDLRSLVELRERASSTP
jgi:hypothetical protein